MTYAELIKELFEKSGAETIAEYADRVGVTRTHMSNILRTEKTEQKGSVRILELCLRDAGKQDALRLEDDEPTSKEEAEALRLFRGLDEKMRDLALRWLRTLPREKKASHK